VLYGLSLRELCVVLCVVCESCVCSVVCESCVCVVWVVCCEGFCI